MQKAIVVGASSGIGRELAQYLAAQGYRVGITSRRTELLSRLRAENPAAYVVQEMNIDDTATTSTQLSQLAAELGGVDLLVISAGIGEVNESLDFAIEERTIATNVLGFTNVAGWAFRYFQQQQSGHLVAITSIAALRGNGSAPAYNASKAYQMNYLEGLRQKARKLPFRIHITDIRPGFVATDMAKGDGLFWVMPVKKTVRQIYQAIAAKRRASYVTKRWGLVATLFKRIPNALYERM